MLAHEQGGSFNAAKLAGTLGSKVAKSEERAQRAEGRNTSADVSSIALAKEERRGYKARRADHACARCSRPTLLGRNRGEAANCCPFAAFGHARMELSAAHLSSATSSR